MLGFVTRLFNSPAPSMLNQTSYSHLSESSRRSILDMTRGLSREHQETVNSVLAEFGDQGIERFHEFGLTFKAKRLAWYDDTLAYYTPDSRRIVLNKRREWDGEEGRKTVRHELFHVVDHLMGEPRSSLWGDSMTSSALSSQDEQVSALYSNYRSRGALQYAMDFRDYGERPLDDNMHTGKEMTTIKRSGDSFKVDTDPNWLSRQHGLGAALACAAGVGLMAVGGWIAPAAGVALLGVGALGGKNAAKEAVDRYLKPADVRTFQDSSGRKAEVRARGDEFTVTTEPGFERQFSLWSEYAMETDLTSEYFAEAGSSMLSGGVYREAIELTDPEMAGYVSAKWEQFTGQALPGAGRLLGLEG